MSNKRKAKRPERGGFDSGVPQIMTMGPSMPLGRIRTGHTWNLRDNSEPVIIIEGTDQYPHYDGDVVEVEGRCRTCVAHGEFWRPPPGSGSTDGVMVVEHEPGCPFMEDLMAARNKIMKG